MIKIKITNRWKPKQVLFEGKIKESSCEKFLRRIKKTYKWQFNMRIEMEKIS